MICDGSVAAWHDADDFYPCWHYDDDVDFGVTLAMFIMHLGKAKPND